MQRPPEPVRARRPERRRSRRYPFDAILEMQWGSAVLQGRVRDISTEGMFVELADPLWVGASFSAQMAHRDEPLQLECVVRRVAPGQGMAVTFVAAGEEDRRRLHSLFEMLTLK